jgi:hypothetical protein
VRLGDAEAVGTHEFRRHPLLLIGQSRGVRSPKNSINVGSCSTMHVYRIAARSDFVRGRPLQVSASSSPFALKARGPVNGDNKLDAPKPSAFTARLVAFIFVGSCRARGAGEALLETQAFTSCQHAPPIVGYSVSTARSPLQRSPKTGGKSDKLSLLSCSGAGEICSTSASTCCCTI